LASFSEKLREPRKVKDLAPTHCGVKDNAKRIKVLRGEIT
jgi:hypothetical protein